MKLACGWTWILFQVCWTLEGPKRVTGPAGGSVSVQCRYSRGYEESVKYWCKEARVRLCSSKHSIQTTGSEAEVKKWNRVSIKDNHALRIFMVTMENLTTGDAGMYLCGVEKTGQYDIWHPVDVRVTADFPSPNHSGKNEQSTEKTGKLDSTTMAPERFQHSNIHVMLLVFLKIPIFLAMIAAVVWVHIWDKRGRISNAKVPATREKLQVVTYKAAKVEKMKS